MSDHRLCVGAKGGLIKCWVGLSVQLLPGEKQAVRMVLLQHDPLMSLHVFDPQLGVILVFKRALQQFLQFAPCYMM